MGPRGTRLRGEWRKLHNEELNDLHSAPNIIRVKKEKGGARSAHEGRREVSTEFWWGKQKKRPLRKTQA